MFLPSKCSPQCIRCPIYTPSFWFPPLMTERFAYWIISIFRQQSLTKIGHFSWNEKWWVSFDRVIGQKNSFDSLDKKWSILARDCTENQPKIPAIHAHKLWKKSSRFSWLCFPTCKYQQNWLQIVIWLNF